MRSICARIMRLKNNKSQIYLKFTCQNHFILLTLLNYFMELIFASETFCQRGNNNGKYCPTPWPLIFSSFAHIFPSFKPMENLRCPWKATLQKSRENDQILVMEMDEKSKTKIGWEVEIYPNSSIEGTT